MFLSFTAQGEIAIIANLANPAGQMTVAEARQLWLGKSAILGSGKVVVADQKENSALRREFAEKVLGQNGRQMRAYWSRQVLSGQASPPEVLGSDAEVKMWVESQPDGLGYVDAAAVDGGVKVLLRVP